MGHERQTPDRKRRDNLSQISCTLVTVLLLVFATNSVRTGEMLLALVLCAFATANLAAMMLYQHFHKIDIFGHYLSISYSAICLYLVSTGGSYNTGLLWLPCYPVVMYSILRLRLAVIANLLLTAAVTYILFFASNPLYTATYITHYKFVALATYTLTSTFSFFQASWRNKSLTDNERLTKELKFIASTDELTDLPNRRDMAARLEFETKRAKRSGSEFSIILADIDYFKKINDNFGHDVGDQVLTEFSDIFNSRFRTTDKVGRWGGEEFLVILPDTNLQEAIKLADEVRKTVSQASLIPHMPNRLVTVSAGVASSKEIEEISELLKVADKRLYAAKDAGRNRINPER